MVERARVNQDVRDGGAWIQEQSLTTFAGPKVKLKDEERRAILALDSLRVPLSMKKTVFAADVFLRDGAFRAVDVLSPDREPDVSYDREELGKIVDARDMVMIDPRFEAVWIQVGLLKESNFVEVALSKKMGDENAHIAGKLNIDVSEVEEILKTLDDFGVFKDMDYRKIKQAYLLRKLEMIDKERQEFGLQALSNPELGRRFGRSADTIDDWRSKNRSRGKTSTRGRDAVIARGEEIRAVMIDNPDLTNPQAVELLISMGYTDVNINVVKYHRNVLIGSSQVDRKRSLSTKGETAKAIADRAAKIKDVLRLALEKCRQERKPLILKNLKEDYGGLADVPYTTLLHYYHQVKKDQEVQELKLGRTSR